MAPPYGAMPGIPLGPKASHRDEAWIDGNRSVCNGRWRDRRGIVGRTGPLRLREVAAQSRSFRGAAVPRQLQGDLPAAKWSGRRLRGTRRKRTALRHRAVQGRWVRRLRPRCGPRWCRVRAGRSGRIRGPRSPPLIRRGGAPALEGQRGADGASSERQNVRERRPRNPTPRLPSATSSRGNAPGIGTDGGGTSGGRPGKLARPGNDVVGAGHRPQHPEAVAGHVAPQRGERGEIVEHEVQLVEAGVRALCPPGRSKPRTSRCSSVAAAEVVLDRLAGAKTAARGVRGSDVAVAAGRVGGGRGARAARQQLVADHQRVVPDRGPARKEIVGGDSSGLRRPGENPWPRSGTGRRTWC